VNEMHIANYLASLLDDTAATFYQDIRRLPPAHHLLINREGLKIQRYWALDPASEMPNRSDREYAEAFRELFTTAVRCRSRRGGPVGAMLSGGLDSSAITQVARTLHGDDAVLHTFSATFDKVKECDERFYINTLLAQPRLRPHYLPAEETGILVDLDRLLWHTDEPFIAPGLLMTWRLYDIAAHHGVRVLLDGHGGDEVVSTGDAYLKELARAGRWLTLARELKRLANLHGDTWWEWFGPYASHYLLKPVVRRAWPVQALRRRVASVRQMPPPSGSVASQASWEPFIAPNFVQRTGLAERYRSSQQHRPELALEERERHYRILASGFQPYALEVLDRVAGAFPVEPRYPFLDRRLVEFCLALPANQKLRNGWGRFILRQAMEGTLPREIQWRAGKTDFSPALTHGLRALQNNQLGITTNRDVEHLAAYVNVDALRDAARRVASSTGQASQRDVDIVLKCVILSRWLGSTHPQ
jgi:asparagine synthase (glutamine-hydrolysing)